MSKDSGTSPNGEGLLHTITLLLSLHTEGTAHLVGVKRLYVELKYFSCALSIAMCSYWLGKHQLNHKFSSNIRLNTYVYNVCIYTIMLANYPIA